jgi:hypothetical protein
MAIALKMQANKTIRGNSQNETIQISISKSMKGKAYGPDIWNGK